MGSHSAPCALVAALTLAALTLTPPTFLAAQEGALLAPGARVRVTVARSGETAPPGASGIPIAPGVGSATPAGRLVIARVLAATPDSLVLLPERRGDTPRGALRDTLRTGVSSVTRLEVSRGRHAAVGRGIAFGALAGAAAGALIGALATSCESGPLSFCDVDRGVNALRGAGVGVLAGGLVGGGIGSTRRIDSWQAVPLPRRAGLGPASRGVTLAWRLRF